MSWSLVLWVFCCFCDKWVPSCNFVFRLTSSSFPGCEVLGKGGRGGGGNWGGSVGTREGSRSPVLGVAGLLLARAFLGFVLERGSSFWSFVPGGVAGEGSRPHLWRRLGGAGGGWGCSVSLVTCDHGREKRRGHLTAGQGCRACCHACRMGGTFACVKPWEKSKFRHLSSFQQLSQDTVDKMVWPLKNQVFDLRGSSFTEERSSLTLCMCGEKKTNGHTGSLQCLGSTPQPSARLSYHRGFREGKVTNDRGWSCYWREHCQWCVCCLGREEGLSWRRCRHHFNSLERATQGEKGFKAKYSLTQWDKSPWQNTGLCYQLGRWTVAALSLDDYLSFKKIFIGV